MIELIYSDQVTPQLSEDLIRFCEQAEIEKKQRILKLYKIG